MSTPALVMQPGLPPAVRRVRGYFAPVDRLSATPTAFDATTVASFDADTPPAPWTDLGWINGFTRASETKLQVVESGAPGTVLLQGRQSAGATVSMTFERWSKLTMALTCGAQQTNVLKAGANPVAITAATSTATFSAHRTEREPSRLGTSSRWMRTTAARQDISARERLPHISRSDRQRSELDSPHDAERGARDGGDGERAATRRTIAGRRAGAGDAGAVDRCVAGSRRRHLLPGMVGTVFHAGRAGRCVVFYYPRLQTIERSCGDHGVLLTAPLSQLLLNGHFVALPVVDSVDGAQVCCYRTYLPCANAQI